MAGSAPARQKRVRIPQIAPVIRFGALLIAFILGMIGFQQVYADLGQKPSLLLILTQSLRLIVGAFPADLEGRDLPVTLAVARIALPLLTLWTSVALAWGQVRNPLRLALARARGEHLVIGGDSGLAALVTRGELERQRRVVIWADDAHAPWIGAAVDIGAAHVQAEPARDDKDKLGLASARGALIVGPDDSANVAAATALLDGVGKWRPAGDPLPLIARVDDLDFRARIEARFERGSRGLARVRFASLPDLAARQLFLDAPLDSFRRAGDSRRTIFVFGLTPAVERYLLRIMVGGHFRDGIKPRIVVVAREIAQAEEQFRIRNGEVDTLSPVVFETGSYDIANRVEPLLGELVARHGHPVAILVDCKDDPATLSTAMAVDDFYRAADVAAPLVHIRVQSGQDHGLGGMIRNFGTLDRFADPDLLTQEAHDQLARSIHEFYLEGRLAEGDKVGSRASMHEWDDLPERFRDDNRLVADCYQLKLRDIGARLVDGTGPPLRFEPDELEELSRAEHDRWMAAKLADHWVYGPERDDTRKIHPDIVPYDALSERIKDLDREQIRVMTRLLAAKGRRAVRLIRVAVLPGEQPLPPLDALLAQLARHYPDRVPLLSAALADVGAHDALAKLNAPFALLRLHVCGNVNSVLDGLGHQAQRQATALIRDADTIIALPAGAQATESLLADAQLTVSAPGRDGALTGPQVVLAASGAVAGAPWQA